MTVTANPGGKARRHQLIRQLVAQYAVGSQSELVALLAQHGIEATQATVSRDLEELHIDKLRGADNRVSYVLPEPMGLSRMLRQFVIGFDASGNLAVVRTPPGGAATVAAAIDQARVPGVLATVQGDDTILVVAEEGLTGREIAERLSALKESRPPVPMENDS